jgi:hypothetical protein
MTNIWIINAKIKMNGIIIKQARMQYNTICFQEDFRISLRNISATKNKMKQIPSKGIKTIYPIEIGINALNLSKVKPIMSQRNNTKIKRFSFSVNSSFNAFNTIKI